MTTENNITINMQDVEVVNSTTTWRDAIAAVKTKYAKPS